MERKGDSSEGRQGGIRTQKRSSKGKQVSLSPLRIKKKEWGGDVLGFFENLPADPLRRGKG